MTRRTRRILAPLLLACCAAGAAQIRTVIIPFPPYPGDEELNRMEIKEDRAFFDGRNSRLVIVRGPAAGDPARAAGPETIRIDFTVPIAPELSVDVTRATHERWLYNYTVANGPRGTRAIESWYLDIPQPRSPDPLDADDKAFPVDRSGVWEFSHFGYRPGSWAMLWKRGPGVPPLTPGGRGSDFLVESDRRPGFLTAYFEGRPSSPMIPDGLSEKLAERLREFLRTRTQSVQVLTLGPKFRNDTDRRAMAADFHVGISRLGRHGRLEADSPFVATCLEYLQNLIDEPTISETGLAPDFQANPRTPLERSVHRALRLALDLPE